jgi:hypothetical protein
MTVTGSVLPLPDIFVPPLLFSSLLSRHVLSRERACLSRFAVAKFTPR